MSRRAKEQNKKSKWAHRVSPSVKTEMIVADHRAR